MLDCGKANEDPKGKYMYSEFICISLDEKVIGIYRVLHAFFFFFFWPSFSLDILLMKIPIRIKFHSKTAVVSGIWDDRKNFVSIFTTSEEYLKGLVTPECEHFHWYYDNILLSNYALLAASVMSLSR